MSASHKTNDIKEDRFKDLESRIKITENKILNKDEKASENNNNSGFTDTVYDLAGTTLGAIVLGWFLDNYFETTPWLLIVMAIFGVASGILLLWKKQQASLEKEKKDKA